MTHGLTNSNVAARAAPLLALAFERAQSIHAFTEASIPSRLRLWGTEFGHMGSDGWATKELDGTWLEGIYFGAAAGLLLRTARVDVAVPYCMS